MKLRGSPEWLMEAISLQCPDCGAAIGNSAHIKGQLEPYQAAALFALAREHDGGQILEIGTLHGYSASIMAQAAPGAQIVTLNSAAHEIVAAFHNLEEWSNVRLIQTISWEWLRYYRGPFLDMIFVDGDHKRVSRDVPWWDWVAEGGLMLFHDYSPEQCPPVYEAVNRMAETLGREPDVLVVDDDQVGLAGFYRGDNDDYEG